MAGATKSIDSLRGIVHGASLVSHVARTTKLSSIFLFATVLLIVLWLISFGGLMEGPGISTNARSETSVDQADTTITQQMNAEPIEGASMSTENSTSSNTSTVQSNVSVSTTNDGSTVTVNGDTTTVPEGQKFEHTYQSGDENNSSRVTISIDQSNHSP